MMSFIAISLILSMTAAIYQQTGLVFLGLVPLSGANWGVMLSLAYNRGAIYQIDAAWNVLVPVGAIAIFQLSLVWLSRGLEEVFNPRLRTSV
jgi:peptide/nickel transport system permease protein